jgi:hypothetical protein
LRLIGGVSIATSVAVVPLATSLPLARWHRYATLPKTPFGKVRGKRIRENLGRRFTMETSWFLMGAAVGAAVIGTILYLLHRHTVADLKDEIWDLRKDLRAANVNTKDWRDRAMKLARLYFNERHTASLFRTLLEEGTDLLKRAVTEINDLKAKVRYYEEAEPADPPPSTPPTDLDEAWRTCEEAGLTGTEIDQS